MKRIFVHQLDDQGCGHYRSKFPVFHCFESLSKKGCFLDLSDKLHSNSEYDAYVFQRVPSENLISLIYKEKQNGKKIVWQIDDDVWSIENWMASQEGARHYKWSIDKMKEISDQIWVSTECLCKKIGMEKKTKILPNLIDLNQFKPKQPLRDDIVRILWFGGISHENDLKLLYNPIKTLLQEYGSLLQFVFWGFINSEFLEHQRISGTMKAEMSVNKDFGETIWYLEGVPFSCFYNHLISLRPHITLCPLVDCEFNKSKSNIKFLESTMSGGATIATNIQPYSSSIENEISGLLINNTDESWYCSMKKLIDDLDLRNFLAENAYQKVSQEFSWQSNKKDLWVKAFESIL